MPNIYCPSWGSGTKYLYEKPVNCPSCSKAFARPVIVPEEEDLSSINTPSVHKKNRLDKNILKNVQVIVEEPIVAKLGEIIGSSPGEVQRRRSPANRSDFKKKIFERRQNDIE